MKRILISLVMVIAMTAIATPCWACSCLPNDTKRDKAKRADVVFTGTVTSIADPNPADATAAFKVQFEVAKVYKGNPREITHVYTAKEGSMCGVTFEVGERYTVFATWSGSQKWVGMCSGTKAGRIDPDFWGLPEGYPPRS